MLASAMMGNVDDCVEIDEKRKLWADLLSNLKNKDKYEETGTHEYAYLWKQYYIDEQKKVLGKCFNAKTFAHEIGHNLGLWHTHHGESEHSKKAEEGGCLCIDW